MREFALQQRRCECCGSDDLEKVWDHAHEARTITDSWKFRLTNVICKKCGFVFVAPAPAPGCLLEYYADNYVAYDDQALDYDITYRIEFIRRCMNGSSVFVDVGSNKRSEFHTQVGRLFERVLTIEPNCSAGSELRSLDALPGASVDMLAHYFVLEHLPAVKEFLAKCHAALKPEGVMVVEVPDISCYPSDICALFAHEHMNHFSQKTLERIAAGAGFRRASSSLPLCSRPYGFVAAYVKQASIERPVRFAVNEYVDNKALFMRGVDRYRSFVRQLQDASRILAAHHKGGRKAVLWGANDRLLQFLAHGGSIPESAVVVDSDPAKSRFSNAFTILQPQEAREHILASDLILVFTRLHSEAILGSVKTSFGKSFDKDRVLILDC